MSRRPLFFIPLVTLLLGFISKGTNDIRIAFYECSNPYNIDSTLFEVRKDQAYFQLDKNLRPKKLKSKGFIRLKNNPKDYFTAYLINTSDSTFHATRQDFSLIMVQEALNEEGKWKPIEHWIYSTCGNSYMSPLELLPGKYVMIPIKKYTGSFQTKFRLKMQQNDSITFYSETFEGSIDKGQFINQQSSIQVFDIMGPR